MSVAASSTVLDVDDGTSSLRSLRHDSQHQGLEHFSQSPIYMRAGNDFPRAMGGGGVTVVVGPLGKILNEDLTLLL